MSNKDNMVTDKQKLSVKHDCKEKLFVKQVYEVNTYTGKISPISVPSHDRSYLSRYNVFESIDSAEAFSEGIVPTVNNEDGNVTNTNMSDDSEHTERNESNEQDDEQDDELDQALDSIENDIAMTLMRESMPESDPNPTEIQVDHNLLKDGNDEMLRFHMESQESEATSNSNDNYDSEESPTFIKLPARLGSTIYHISTDNGRTYYISKDKVVSIAAYINSADDISYVYHTEEGENVTSEGVNIIAFFNKDLAKKKLFEIIDTL